MYKSEYFNNRFILYKKSNNTNNNVLYLAYRDLRVYDNWSFLFSQNIANNNKSSMYMLYIVNKNNSINSRQYKFLYEGLPELDILCKKFNVAFHLLLYDAEVLANFVNKYKIGNVIIEQTPLDFHELYYKKPLDKLNVNVYIVDSHNIIPVWVTSNKQEYNARTIRNKINKIKNKYLIEFPKVKNNTNTPIFVNNNFNIIPHDDNSITNIYNIIGGHTNGMNKFNIFKNKINLYKNKKK